MVHTNEDAKANKKQDVTFEVLEEIAVISKRSKDCVIRLDYAKWNNAAPKYELHKWEVRKGDTELSPTKGVGLTGEELIELGRIIAELQKGE